MASVALKGFYVGKTCWDDNVFGYHTIGVYLEGSTDRNDWWPDSGSQC